jgi:peptidoglycan glycosyltransferase
VSARVAHLGRFLSGLFVALLVYLAGVQVVWGPRIADQPGNPRLALAAEHVRWGRILDRRLTVLADSQEAGGRQVRRYPSGDLFAHVLGYRSARYGLAGVEAQYDATLLGVRAQDPWQALQEAFGAAPRGDDLVLTVDTVVQRAAVQALAGRRGAIVALDPRTGAVLALASRPTFDPSAVDARWAALSHDPTSPLLDRATQGQYPPGSTFKPVVLAAALATGRVTPHTVVDCPAEITVAGAVIGNFDHERYGRVTVARAFAYSCNTSFVRIGLKTGSAPIVRMARAFGLGRVLPFDLPTAAGYLPVPRDLGRRGLAQLSFGQGTLLVTPLQMALVAETIANRGVMMRPFLLSQVRGPGGRVLEAYAQRGSRDVISSRIAAAVAQAMVDVVQSGTGTAAQIAGVPVAGKTGTAENPHGPADAWFIGFAPVGRPVVAVAVLLENAGVGGDVAAPAARRVIQAALGAALRDGTVPAQRRSGRP